ncbi:hypothetical protein Tco_0179416 [Tanacetum coccineum]
MPVNFGSFDAIIGMDWLAKYQEIIVCAEKIVSNPMEMKLFLAHVTTKEVEDNSEKKRLKDVPIVRDFPKVFPEDFPGLPPTRQVEFQIDLVPGAAPVASGCRIDGHLLEMKELVFEDPKTNDQNLSPEEGSRFERGDNKNIFSTVEQKLCSGTKPLALPEMKAKILSHTAMLQRREERDQPVISSSLSHDIGLDLPKQILNAQTEAWKSENLKNEYVGGMLVENAKKQNAD